MFSHNYSVFASSCVKPPLHSVTKLPNPSYLKPKCVMKEGKSSKSNLKKCKKFSSLLSLTAENNNFLSLKDFYDSIPDYNELHHLSQCDFYKEIDTLKRKRNELRSSIFGEDYFQVWNKVETPEMTPLPCTEPPSKGSSKHFNDFHAYKFSEYSPRVTSADPKMKSSRKGSAKSVRIEADPVPYITPNDDNPTRIFKKSLRAKSASPVRENPTITVTEPFKMTQREDQQKTFDDLLFESKEFLTPEKTIPKFSSSPSRIKANPVPITSKIPLFKQIMEDKEHKSQLAKLDSAMELNAQIKPFGFDNGPDRPHSRCLSRSLSSPHINLTPEPPSKPFKASPVPKSSYSNYFQTKMSEEEYFRNMNKRIRAEELLKMATLPPSMKRREKSDKKRYEHSCSSQSLKRPKRKRKGKKSRISSCSTTKTSNSSISKPEEFITTCPHPFDLMTRKRSEAKSERLRKSTTTPTTTSSKSSFDFLKTTQPSPLYPVNRPNLAATLRYEHSRHKIQELQERATSSLSGSTVRPYRWNVQKTPGWQSLAMDPTHAEELQLRLATRRAEQKLRQEEYKMSKELMIQRVKAAPLLLEGPSHWGPKVGQLSHHCGTENSERNRRAGSAARRPTSSKMSNYSSTNSKASSSQTATKVNLNLNGKSEFDDDFYDNSNSEIE
ncbi:protein FAM161A [Culicoides brevitarsis]|uniref:protein FAM161A n=1 Tax=Culicoides brevitarsis TaxID=469753 RepID=UPI00307BDFC2